MITVYYICEMDHSGRLMRWQNAQIRAYVSANMGRVMSSYIYYYVVIVSILVL